MHRLVGCWEEPYLLYLTVVMWRQLEEMYLPAICRLHAFFAGPIQCFSLDPHNSELDYKVKSRHEFGCRWNASDVQRKTSRGPQ
jgi:hypothetical protein